MKKIEIVPEWMKNRHTAVTPTAPEVKIADEKIDFEEERRKIFKKIGREV